MFAWLNITSALSNTIKTDKFFLYLTDICNKYDFKFAVYKILNKFFEVLLTKKKTRIQSTCKLHSKAFNWVQYNYITWSWMHFLYYVTYFCKNYKAPINLIKKRITLWYHFNIKTQQYFGIDSYFKLYLLLKTSFPFILANILSQWYLCRLISSYSMNF